MPARFFAFVAVVSAFLVFGAGQPRVAPVAPAMYDGALILEQPLEQLAKKADRIVVGTVTEVTSQKTSTSINTRVKVKVAQEIKGKGQQELTLMLEGGTVGDLRLDVGGVPRFSRNERVLLLLDGAASPRIAGGWQGKYSLAGSRAYNAEQKSESIKGVAAKLSKALDKNIEIEEDDNEAASMQFTTYCSPWSTSDVAGFSNGSWVSTPHADMAVGFEVNTSNPGSGGPTGANFARLAYSSWRNWQALTDSYPSFAYLGTTTRDGTNHMDGNNTIAWSNLGNSGTLGVNYCVYTSAGRVDSDTLINSNSAYPWDWDDSNGISGGTFSLQAVMEHELGHGLGLGHSNQTCNGSASTPLMCPAVSSGVRKTILTDDSNGAASNYPISGSAPGAPTGLTATDNGTSFTLNWTASSGSPLAYEIERGNSDCGGGWTPAGTVDSRTYGYNSSGGAIATSPVTTFTDNDFGAGLSGDHCYRIRALGVGGDSTWTLQTVDGDPQTVGVSPDDAVALVGDDIELGTTFRHTAGASQLRRVEMIVPASNGNWQQGCWVVYMPETDRLYLVNDSSVWLNAGAPGSGSTVEDGQCSLDGAASSVGTTGNDMTVTFALSFKSGFEGSRPIRMRSQEKDTLETSAIGLHGYVHVVTDSGPQTISVSPVGGSVDVGTGIELAATFGHGDGVGNLRRLEMVVAGPGGSWQLGCWAVYMVETNRLYLIDDDSVWLNAGAPGSANTVQDDQCILSAAGSSTSVTGNTRTVTFDLTFKAGFEGGRLIRLRAQELGSLSFSSVSTHATITIE